MKIHYISCHSVLEYDEVKLLTELGHDVFANGAYLDPRGHITLPRPGIEGMTYHEDWAKLAAENPKTKLPRELIEPFDVIIVMHEPNVLVHNWDQIRHKKVIWRSIGQSTAHVENMLKPLREDGLIIVRYSPKEANIKDFIGEDAMIRFYKDPEEYKDWDGHNGDVISFAQSLKGRRDFCHYDEIMPVIELFKGKVYGPGNDDIGEFNGGQIPYEMQMNALRGAGVLIYGGTWPASYTLTFIEGLMTGTPIVAVSKEIAHVKKFEFIDFYEVDEIMARISGPVCDSVEQMIELTERLRSDKEYANEMSRRGRELAIELFGKANIAKQWQELLRRV